MKTGRTEVDRYSTPCSGGAKTSNYAEYQSLIDGMDVARRKAVGNLLVNMDSELVVRQVTGEYHCREPRLVQQKAIVDNARRFFSVFNINHIPRAANSDADALANAASRISEQAYKRLKSELWQAVKQGNVAVVDRLLSQVLQEGWLPPRVQGSSHHIHSNHLGWTLIHEAVDNGHMEVVRLLATKGEVGINSPKQNGLTAVHIAAQKGRISDLAALRALGANMDGVSAHYSVLKKELWAAVAKGDVQVAKAAIDTGLLTRSNCRNHQVGYPRLLLI
jgi:ribonuclease HI